MEQEKSNFGTLYIVATPIGNLSDITLRALETLRKVDLIAAEDTRHTIKLLNRYKIKKRLISYHEHSNPGRERELIEALKDGLNVALVSDAGTPLISDPGARLVKKCIEEGIALESVPGPCAAITAAAVSGIDVSGFIFSGFLETKSSTRKKELNKLYECRLPVIIYESPNRILKTIDDIIDIWGADISVCAARELTKVHEEFIRGSAVQVKERLSEKTELKGEFVLIISARERDFDITDEEIMKAVRHELALGKSKKEAARHVAEQTGRSKNEVYKLALLSDKTE